ncbi:MAG: hypothetical protein EA397_10500 [Deltaproteobacteria bacterium]|nr:MAG: hypothetical protein EA397_10500 [Deltaproteobacteria bacterium]
MSSRLALALTSSLILACAGGVDLEEPRPVRASTPSFDRLFDGIERGCSIAPELAQLLESLASETPEGRWSPSSSVTAPSEIASSLGVPELLTSGESHTSLLLPVTGATWHGYEVRGIEHTRGHSNGIYVFALVLRENAETLDKELKQRFTITDSCAGIEDCVTEPAMMRTLPHSEGAALTCDLSV